MFPLPVKCDSSKMLNSGFGGAYSEGDDAGAELEKGMNVKLEYKVMPLPLLLLVRFRQTFHQKIDYKI